MDKIKLSKDFAIPAIDYAGQANAILGIRDAGKTYTAMKAAEQLLDAGIPIVVFDPIGVWHNLKYGFGSFKGYPVVVAGGEGSDIILTPNNAKDIVQAAMIENVSLVIDLYSPELINKSTWIRIVEETVMFLMYNNKSHGMRHIFIEEAAEFIPQRLQPQHSKVYSAIERLARMGRNAKLGMTIINQRAEEVNKAILEICELSLLHKQVGKNSLKSIGQWLELRQIDNVKDIIKSLPALKQGECWVVGHGSNPQLIKILPKVTFHPNPKAKDDIKEIPRGAVDISTFVEKLRKQLEKEKAVKIPAKKEVVFQADKTAATIEALKKESDYYRDGFHKRGDIIKHYRNLIGSLIKQIEQFALLLNKANTFDDFAFPAEIPKVSLPEQLVSKSVQKVHNSVQKFPSSDNSQVKGGAMRMLKAAAMYYPDPVTVQRMAALSAMSSGSGTFGVYFRTLKREGLITVDGKNVLITDEGKKRAGDVQPLSTNPDDLLEMWCNNIGRESGVGRMLRHLFQQYPNWVTAEELGEATSMSAGSGTFGVYERQLRRLGLAEKQSGQFKAADELFK